MSQKFTIFALSDATGGLANNFATAAVNQFPAHNSKIIRVPKITKKEQISEYVIKAQQSLGVIVFTFVKTEMRREILELAKQHQVVAIDIMGPALDSLSNYFHTLPSNEPGLQYQQTGQYFKRIEALEFTVKHDDGLGSDSIHKADILLLGVSRSSKTPLSIYLAYQGFCCANISITKDMPLPNIIYEFDKSKMIGVIIDEERLALVRSTRMSKMGRSEKELYSDPEHVRAELDYAKELYKKLDIRVVDLTGKAIEESASEIISTLNL